MRKLLSFIFFVFISLSVLGEKAGQKSNFLFETVKATGVGLNHRINCIIKDPFGFMWFGTDYGLLRYDGYRTQRIEFDDISGRLLSTIGIEAMELAKDSSLCIGTSQGLFMVNLANYTLSQPKRFQNVNVRALLIENDSVLWLGTSEGLYRYNTITTKRVYLNSVNNNLSQNVIRVLYRDLSGNLWVGTENKLNILYKGSSKFKSFDLKGDYKNEIANNLILDIKPFSADNDSLLLVGTETGLCLFNRQTEKFSIYNSGNTTITNDVIKSVYHIDENRICLGTDLGFFILDIQSHQSEHYLHNPFNHFSISNNEVWDIYSDNTGMLWLGTSNGISKLNLDNDYFQYVAVTDISKGETVGTRVADITTDLNNNTWVGTGNGLFCNRESTKDEFIPVLQHSELAIENINAVFTDSLNRVWLGTVAGLRIYDDREQKIYSPPIDRGTTSRVSANYISNLLPGRNNELWIGTWGGGLYKVDYSIEKSHKIMLQYVGDLNGEIVMGDNHIWSLFVNELYRYNFNSQKVENVKLPTELSSDMRISSIAFSDDGFIWMGSVNELIKYHIEQDTFEVIHMPFENEIIVTGLFVDGKNNLWGSSNNIVFRYNMGENQFTYFPQSGDLPLKKFILSPFRELSQQEIAVCGYDGFLKFSPSDFPLQNTKVKVFISAMKVNGDYLFSGMKTPQGFTANTILLNDQYLKFSHDENTFSFELSTFNYKQLQKEQYMCKLDGYDENWRLIELGKNTIEYLNVPPGKYVFRAKSYNQNSIKEETTFAVQIKKPLLLGIPFIIAYVFFILAIALFVFMQYHKSIQYKAQMNLIKLEQDKNQEFTNSKIRFYVNISHELLTSISLIIDPIKNLLRNSEIKEKTRETLELVDRNAYFLKVYIDQLLNFRKLETGHKISSLSNEIEIISLAKEVLSFFKNKALNKGVILKLEAGFKELTISTDEEKIYSIFQNLLSNAIKYTPRGGQILLKLTQHNTNLVIEVRDTGAGIPNEEQEKIFERFYKVESLGNTGEGAGIGLTIVKDFAEILGGSIMVQSEVGKGAIFSVQLPVSNINDANVQNTPYVKEYVTTENIKKSSPILGKVLTQKSELPSVLLIDQYEDVYLYMLSSLKDKYNFSWANTGKEAIKMLENETTDIIVSEMQLSDMDGIKLCKKIRNNPKTARLPLIFLTVKSETENQLKAIEAGVDIFQPKPIEIEILEANIANLLRRTERTKAFINRKLMMNEREVEVESKDDKLLKELVDYIHKHITETNIASKDICYALGVSHSSLYRKIKKLTGQSLNEFIRYVRLQKAEKLLTSGRFAVAEVMFQTGFTNHSYFARCFKSQYGVTPKEYQGKG